MANPEDRKPKQPKEEETAKTLRDRDEDRWKAQKKMRQGKKDAARKSAKANGHRMGRWIGGGALCKNGGKTKEGLAAGCDCIIRWNGFGMDDPQGRDATKQVCTARRAA